MTTTIADTSWVQAVRQIVSEHQHQYIDPDTGRMSSRKRGVMVDAFTASMLLGVYNRLNDANKAKFAALPLLKAVAVGWKLVS